MNSLDWGQSQSANRELGPNVPTLGTKARVKPLTFCTVVKLVFHVGTVTGDQNEIRCKME